MTLTVATRSPFFCCPLNLPVDFRPSTPRQEGDSSKNIGSIIQHITHVIRPISRAGSSRSPLTAFVISHLPRAKSLQQACRRPATSRLDCQESQIRQEDTTSGHHDGLDPRGIKARV
ncbi:hypothetical protein HN011_007433 [Eciton burchellii]|nr:hypothetical protein HN011_007433 [Eciton burchellii]